MPKIALTLSKTKSTILGSQVITPATITQINLSDSVSVIVHGDGSIVYDHLANIEYTAEETVSEVRLLLDNADIVSAFAPDGKDNLVSVRDTTTNEVLKELLMQTKLNNLYLSFFTGERFTENDINNE